MTTFSDRTDDSLSEGVALDLDSVAGESDYCARNSVGLFPAGNHGWVIRAVGSAGQDGAVLGRIESSEDQFELMQLVGGFRWSIHDSLHDALERLVRDLPQPGNERRFDNEVDPQRARPIPAAGAHRSRPARGITESGLSLELDRVIDEWIANIAPFDRESDPDGTTPHR